MNRQYPLSATLRARSFTLHSALHRFGVVLLILCAGWGQVASAHLMAAQKGTLNQVGNLVYVVLSVPVSAFSVLDADGDGHLRAGELEANQAAIVAEVRANLKLTDQQRQQGDIADVMLTVSPAHEDSREIAADQLVIMAVVRFAAAPSMIGIEVNLFGKTAAEQAYKISASRPTVSGAGRESATVLLTPRLNSTLFFSRGITQFPTFIALGVEHILTGFDHLLFLIALLISAVSLRRWVSLLTAFTLAHGCTFALASLGVVSLSSAIVEPLIATSVVAVALLQLKRIRFALPIEVVLVFGCGLVHGLGFALAMGEQRIDAAYPLGSIVSFNLGIELGQLLIAVLVWMLVKGVARIKGLHSSATFSRLCSLGVLGLGSVWLIQQMMINLEI